MKTEQEKTQMTEILKIIVQSIQEVMEFGGETTLHFGDAEITIKRKLPQDEQ
jgi:hypothetical protein